MGLYGPIAPGWLTPRRPRVSYHHLCHRNHPTAVVNTTQPYSAPAQPPAGSSGLAWDLLPPNTRRTAQRSGPVPANSIMFTYKSITFTVNSIIFGTLFIHFISVESVPPPIQIHRRYPADPPPRLLLVCRCCLADLCRR